MALMTGIVPDPKTGILTYIKNVPVDVRHVFGGKKQLWRSLKTRDEKEANFRCAPIAQEIERQIAEARKPDDRGATMTVEMHRQMMANERARWSQPDLIDGLYEDDPVFPDGSPSFVDPEAAAIYLYGEVKALTKLVPATVTSGTLSALRDSFVATQGHRPAKDISEMKTYVRRLIEVVGDKEVRSLTPSDFLWFEEWLPHIPARLNARQEAMTFREIAAEVGKADEPRRTARTCKKWFDFWRILFNWAVVRKLMDTNPVIGLAPKITRGKTRHEYDDQDIRDIFTRPMFTGCAKVYDAAGKVYGYRNEPGELIVRDTNYWLPLLACFMGFRLEEAGGMPLDDVAEKDGIHYFDLTKRKLKTDSSPRVVPLHPQIIALGFLDYVAALRRQKEKFLFPDLPHDGDGATRRFTKWWGNWCRENAIVEGEGFDHSRKVFHSFRHTFKTACRGMPEDIHDYLTGHANPSVGRDYGSHRLAVLAASIARVEYPDFPLGAR